MYSSLNNIIIISKPCRQDFILFFTSWTVQQKIPFPFGIVLPFFSRSNRPLSVYCFQYQFPTRNVGSSTIPSFQLLSSAISGRRSSVITFPNLEHSGHMPSGLLKEKNHPKTSYKTCLGIVDRLLTSFVLSQFIIPSVLHTLTETNSGITVVQQPIIYLGAAIFSLIMFFLSVRKPIQIAKKVSSVTALHYQSEIGKSKSQLKSRHFSAWRMALRNIQRTKMEYDIEHKGNPAAFIPS